MVKLLFTLRLRGGQVILVLPFAGIKVTVQVAGDWVYITIVNPPPRWQLRKRFCSFDSKGNPTNCGEWFPEREGTKAVIAVALNKDTNSETQYQIWEIESDTTATPIPVPTPD